MILIHFPVWVTLYFIEPQEFASKHSLRRIDCFDLNDNKVVALTGPSIENPNVSRIIVKSLSSDAYLFSTTFAALVEDITLNSKGDKVAVCSNYAVTVWDITSKSILLVRETAQVVEIEFKGDGSLLIKTNDGEETVQFGSIARAAGKLYLSIEEEEDSLAIE
jgi:hypothetical protein